MGSLCRLRGHAGPVAGMIIRLGEEELTLGRDLASDVVIPDSEVSRSHARLCWEDGQHVARDLRSTNGTFVNGRPVGPAAALKPGDLLTLGKTSVFVYEPMPESELDTAREDTADVGTSTLAMPVSPEALAEARELARGRRLTATEAPAAEQSAAEAVFEAYRRRLEAGDVDGLLALYHAEASVLSGDGLRSGAAISEFLAARYAPLTGQPDSIAVERVAGADALLCRWTRPGARPIEDGFALRDGKIILHFATGDAPDRRTGG